MCCRNQPLQFWTRHPSKVTPSRPTLNSPIDYIAGELLRRPPVRMHGYHRVCFPPLLLMFTVPFSRFHHWLLMLKPALDPSRGRKRPPDTCISTSLSQFSEDPGHHEVHSDSSRAYTLGCSIGGHPHHTVNLLPPLGTWIRPALAVHPPCLCAQRSIP